MTDEKHNGWTNYATWRVNLEIFDGHDSDGEEVDPDSIQEMAEEIVVGSVPSNSLVASYAMAFLSEVNWYEIAEHLTDHTEEDEPEEDDEGDPDAADAMREEHAFENRQEESK